MKNIIKTTLVGIKTDYSLEEKNNGIIVSAPYLDKDEDEDEDIIKRNIVEIENGSKADFVRRFFDEGQTTIVVNLKGYNLDNALFDMGEVPELPTEDPYIIAE
jgi:hypothetical protein